MPNFGFHDGAGFSAETRRDGVVRQTATSGEPAARRQMPLPFLFPDPARLKRALIYREADPLKLTTARCCKNFPTCFLQV